jgi:hypothetical protein
MTTSKVEPIPGMILTNALLNANCILDEIYGRTLAYAFDMTAINNRISQFRLTTAAKRN